MAALNVFCRATSADRKLKPQRELQLKSGPSTLGKWQSPKQASVGSRMASLGPRAMVAEATPESSAVFAKEMERVAAKEALLLAIKDAGGPSALSSGRGNEAARIEVEEQLLGLERLNPTPRPTSSPLLEGSWDFVWVGARSPGMMAARILLARFPPQVASLESLVLQISDGGTSATATLKLFSLVETSVVLSSSLVAEGPLKLKEEYVEGVLATPTVADGSLPEALRPVLEQLSTTAANLPASLKDAFSSGLKVPLAGRYSRELLVSYLDEELMVVRDEFGTADVLVRAPVVAAEVVVESFTADPTDYNS